MKEIEFKNKEVRIDLSEFIGTYTVEEAKKLPNKINKKIKEDIKQSILQGGCPHTHLLWVYVNYVGNLQYK